MSASPMQSAPLNYGDLAPNFSLESTTNQTVTRGQFRNKQALVLIFFQPTPEVKILFEALKADTAAYGELNARIIGIGMASMDDLRRFSADLPFIMLADPSGTTWKAYSRQEMPGFGVFVLDLYGGVDAQRVVASPAELPDAALILDWVRAAQYRCNI